jgi:hypothetical protein
VYFVFSSSCSRLSRRRYFVGEKIAIAFVLRVLRSLCVDRLFRCISCFRRRFRVLSRCRGLRGEKIAIAFVSACSAVSALTVCFVYFVFSSPFSRLSRCRSLRGEKIAIAFVSACSAVSALTVCFVYFVFSSPFSRLSRVAVIFVIMHEHR